MQTTDLLICASPDVLARFGEEDLRRLCDPHREALAAVDSRFAGDASLDRDALGWLILSAGERLPSALVDGLATVAALGKADNLEGLLAVAKRVGVACAGDAVTAISVATRLWCEHPRALAAFEAEQALPQVRKFLCWQCAASAELLPTPEPGDPRLTAFARQVEGWLCEHHHGTGSGCSAVLRDGALWILVRHGATLQRVAVHQDGGRVDSLVFRPAVHDVLRYHPDRRWVEAHVHGDRVHLTAFYQQALSSLLVGRPGCLATAPVYTLTPLERGVSSLAVSDVPGLVQAACVEITLAGIPRPTTRLVLRSTNVFADLEDFGLLGIGQCAVQARFRLRFSSGRSRLITITPPCTCHLPHDADGELITQWLDQRGFITPMRNDHVAAAVA